MSVVRLSAYERSTERREKRRLELLQEGSVERPLTDLDIANIKAHTSAELRARWRDNIRYVIDEVGDMSDEVAELDVVSLLLEREGFPEEFGTPSERLRGLILAYEQQIAEMRK